MFQTFMVKQLKWLVVLYLLVRRSGELIGYSPNLQMVCETQPRYPMSQLIVIVIEKGQPERDYVAHCDRVEPENVDMFGKWRFIIDEEIKP